MKKKRFTIIIDANHVSMNVSFTDSDLDVHFNYYSEM